jgi:Rrf2 family protein
MFNLSQTANHAIRAVTCLSEPCCAMTSIQGVSDCTGIPKPYLAKVMARLAEAGILISRRGVGGGIQLARPLHEISLYDISVAIEGADFLSACLQSGNVCSNSRCCPTHAFWKCERARIRDEMMRITLDKVREFEAARTAKSAP